MQAGVGMARGSLLRQPGPPPRPEECWPHDRVPGPVLSKRINFETQKLLLAPGAVCSIVDSSVNIARHQLKRGDRRG